MNRHMAIISLWIWTFVGLDEAPMYKKPAAVAHGGDFEIGGLISILTPFHRQFVGEEVMRSFLSFREEHFVRRQAFSPPYDQFPRNVTTWMSPNLTIGAESFDEEVVGGPSVNPAQFNPAVVQWARNDGTVGFITLYPEVDAIQAVVSEGKLNLTYPYGNHTSKFTVHVSPNALGGARNVRSWADIDGIDMKVSGNVNLTPNISFCGQVGGDCEPVNAFDLWNFTYSMPPGCAEKPNLVLGIEVNHQQ